MKKEIETPDLKMWLGEDGVFRLKYPPGTHVTLDMMKKCKEFIEVAGEGKYYPVMVFLEGTEGMDRDAREYALSQNYPATALVGASPIARIIGNMAIGFNKKGPTPTRMFASEEEALKWLKKFKSKTSEQ